MKKTKSRKYNPCFTFLKDDSYSKCKETKSTQFLEKINFPVHTATYNFVLVGRKSISGEWWVWRRMRKEDALRMCRMVMFYAKLRWCLDEQIA